MAPRKTPSFSGAGEAQQGASSVSGKAEGGGHGGGGGVGKSSGRRKREGPAEEGGLTEEDLSAPITIRLSETPTMMLLEVRGSAVAMDLRDFGRWVRSVRFLHAWAPTLSLCSVCIRRRQSRLIVDEYLCLTLSDCTRTLCLSALQQCRQTRRVVDEITFSQDERTIARLEVAVIY